MKTYEFPAIKSPEAQCYCTGQNDKNRDDEDPEADPGHQAVLHSPTHLHFQQSLQSLSKGVSGKLT